MARSSSSVGSCSGVMTLAVLLTMIHPLSSSVCLWANCFVESFDGSGETLFQTPRQYFLGKFTADKYHPGIRLFTRKPRFSRFGTHHHVHPLEQHASINTLHVQNTLIAQQIGPVYLENATEELFKALRVKRAVRAKHERTDVVLMRMVVPVVVMRAVVSAFPIMIVMVVVVRRIGVLFGKKLRID